MDDAPDAGRLCYHLPCCGMPVLLRFRLCPRSRLVSLNVLVFLGILGADERFLARWQVEETRATIGLAHFSSEKVFEIRGSSTQKIVGKKSFSLQDHHCIIYTCKAVGFSIRYISIFFLLIIFSSFFICQAPKSS